jgi:RES domain-containing protein
MNLYRIAPARYAGDLTGEGARLFGGRWTPAGVPVLHTAESASLAALEILVHLVNMAGAPKSLRLVSYELDGAAPIEEIFPGDLPDDWRKAPAPPHLQQIGQEWVRRAASIGLRHPSAVMPFGAERNLLINPLFPDFSKLFRLVSIEPFHFDSRLPLPSS